MKGTPLAVVAAFLLVGGCSTPAPNELARSEQPTTSAQPPVTTLELPTTSAAPSSELTPTETTDPDAPVEELPPTAVEIILGELQPRMGAEADIAATIRAILQPIAEVSTPSGSEINEIAVGFSSPNDAGLVLAQVSVTAANSQDRTDVFRLASASLRASGLFITDSVDADDRRSASFKADEGALFDEVTVTASAAVGGGSTLRVTATGFTSPSLVSIYRAWSDAPLPLPEGSTRTLVVLRQSGAGRLLTTTLTMETTAIVENSTPQREANRLVRRIEDTEGIDLSAVNDGDQPLEGELQAPGLDRFTYRVTAGQAERVDSEGELEDIDVVEVRLQAISQTDV